MSKGSVEGSIRAALESCSRIRSPPARISCRVLAPRLRDRLQHLGPRGHPVAGLGREVGAAVEGRLLGREEDVQRPPPVAGHPLDGLHVERVDVGALLPVDLHAHELLVHQRRHLGVFEGLVLHHVAPVAGGVADRHQQRHVALARRRQCLGAPRQPVHGVLRVLAQVGRGLVGERVGHRRQGSCLGRAVGRVGGGAGCCINFSGPYPSFCEASGRGWMLCFGTPTLHFVKWLGCVLDDVCTSAGSGKSQRERRADRSPFARAAAAPRP